jgi:large repetitive protein
LGLSQGYTSRVLNSDVLAGSSWFARTDTAAHEGFHVLVGQYLPSVWDAGDFSLAGVPLGAPIKYLEETAAYAIGHGASLRFFAVPLAPLEAFGSLSWQEGVTVGVYGFFGVGIYYGTR